MNCKLLTCPIWKKTALTFCLLATLSLASTESHTMKTINKHNQIFYPSHDKECMKLYADNPKLLSFFKYDPYGWFEDRSYFDSSTPPSPLKEKINAVIRQENHHYQSFRDQAEEQRIFEVLVSREEKSEDSYPRLRKGYHYFWRTLEGQEYRQYFRKKMGSDTPELLIDENKIVEDNAYEYFSISDKSISSCSNYLAYSFDATGDEVYEIAVIDLRTKEYTTDKIKRASGSVVFHPTQPGFFYDIANNHVPKKIFFHPLGSNPADDLLIYEEQTDVKYISMHISGNQDVLCICSQDTENVCLRVIDLQKDIKTIMTIVSESFGALDINAEAAHGFLYFSINTTKDLNGCLYKAPLDKAFDPKTWELLLPNTPHCLLDDFAVYNNHLAVTFLKNASKKLILFPLDDFKNAIELKISDEPCDIAIDFEESDTPYIRFAYESLLTPPTLYAYTFETKALKQVHQKSVPNYHPSQYRSELYMAKTHDGQNLPISILYHIKNDPMKSPLYVYAYGSYGLSMEPNFTRSALSVTDEGFTFAIVHARGGKECGFEWYQEGKLRNKLNTFQDVISGTQDLVQRFNIKSPGQVVLNGGSAGGLVVGYCANERPDLFGVVIGEVPFVDLLKDMLNATLPLTKGEWREWGNPQNTEDFDYMMLYDPLYNVQTHPYPDMLLTTGLTDYRVPYWEPYKFAFKIREYNINLESLLFVNAYDSGGHFGGSGRYAPLKKIAAKIAFARKAVETWDERRTITEQSNS